MKHKYEVGKMFTYYSKPGSCSGSLEKCNGTTGYITELLYLYDQPAYRVKIIKQMHGLKFPYEEVFETEMSIISDCPIKLDNDVYL